MRCRFQTGRQRVRGAVACNRHPRNSQDRGDIGSQTKQKVSIQRISLRPEYTGAPWLVKLTDEEAYGDIEADQKAKLLTWGTSFDGLSLAIAEDTEKMNVMVQMAASLVLEGCRMYQSWIPKDCADFLVYLGNSLNDKPTVSTPVAVYRVAPLIRPAFDRHKITMEWSVDALTNEELNNTKLCIGNEVPT